MRKKKLLFISSTGGHLTEMLQLKPMFKKYDYYIMTENTPSNKELMGIYPNHVAYILYGTYEKKFTYPFKLLGNCFISLYHYLRIRPSHIITTGSHNAGPMCCIGKILGSKIIFIETLANQKSKTKAGRIIYYFADLFIVQWESMLEIYPKAKYGGWIF